MAKFVIECPQCHNYTMASTFLHRKVDCTCGYTINVATDRMAAKECPHCKNMVVFDQAKGDKALCPVCKEPINTSESMHNAVEISCPSCSCKHGMKSDFLTLISHYTTYYVKNLVFE